MAAVTARQLARVLEHLMRADEIEWLEAIEDHEVDAALVHSFTLRPARLWRQRRLSHDSRHAGHLLTEPGHARRAGRLLSRRLQGTPHRPPSSRDRTRPTGRSGSTRPGRARPSRAGALASWQGPAFLLHAHDRLAALIAVAAISPAAQRGVPPPPARC